MSSDIVLTSALRNNLISLKNTQSLIDQTQQRLATGLKVSSALDNPQSFFTAQALDNRAGDLTRLLDGIGSSLRTIEAADTGITALSGLIDQANAIVSSARDEQAASEGEARIISALDLSNVDNLTDLTDGTVTIVGDETFSFITTDDNGDRIVQEVALGTGTIEDFAAQITNAFADDENGEIVASVNDNGNLIIESVDGRTFSIEALNAADDITDLETKLGFLGLDDQFAEQIRTAAAAATGDFANSPTLAATIVGGNTVSTISLFEGTGDLVEAGDLISSAGAGNEYFDAAGNVVLDEVTALSIEVDVAGTVTTVTGTTFQALVDAVNTNTAINTDVQAEFDGLTGQLRLTALTDDVDNANFVFTAGSDGAIIDVGLGDPTGNLDSLRDGTVEDRTESDETLAVGAGAQEFNITFNSSTQELDRLAQDYNNIRNQIDGLVEDASFRGINLLAGDNLTTFFNEDNSNFIRTEGEIFTADGLGVNEANFRSSANIETTAGEVRSAQARVRAFGSALANDLAVIQTRETFTESLVNTLESGRDDLTVADANEEGANLLALQTRQALGTTSLSLASQSQQSVLRLF